MKRHMKKRSNESVGPSKKAPTCVVKLILALELSQIFVKKGNRHDDAASPRRNLIATSYTLPHDSLFLKSR